MNVIDLKKPKHEINIDHCKFTTAMLDAMDSNMEIEYRNVCVVATLHKVCVVKKYSPDSRDSKKQAIIEAVNECLDKFNKLTGAH